MFSYSLFIHNFMKLQRRKCFRIVILTSRVVQILEQSVSHSSSLVFTGKLLSLCVYTANWLVGFNCNSFYWRGSWRLLLFRYQPLLPCALVRLRSVPIPCWLSVDDHRTHHPAGLTCHPISTWSVSDPTERRRRRDADVDGTVVEPIKCSWWLTLMKFNLTFFSLRRVVSDEIMAGFWQFAAEAT